MPGIGNFNTELLPLRVLWCKGSCDTGKIWTRVGCILAIEPTGHTESERGKRNQTLPRFLALSNARKMEWGRIPAFDLDL